MNSIKDPNDILSWIKNIRDLKKGFVTNYFHDPAKASFWCIHNSLFYFDSKETIFFLRKDHDFFHLSFVSVSYETVCIELDVLQKEFPGTVFTIDSIGHPEDLEKQKVLFLEHKFHHYNTLVRMSRILPSEKEDRTGVTDDIIPAARGDVPSILMLFHRHFDRYSEQIPVSEEIMEWIEKGNVLISREGERIKGFLIFEITGITSYLRYWFVDPAFREQKTGSLLIRRFFYECNRTKRQIFWVIQSNQNAIKRYIHYHFLLEDLADYIFINKNIRYGEHYTQNS